MSWSIDNPPKQSSALFYVDWSRLLADHEDALKEYAMEKEDAPAASWLRKNPHPWVVP